MERKPTMRVEANPGLKWNAMIFCWSLAGVVAAAAAFAPPVGGDDSKNAAQKNGATSGAAGAIAVDGGPSSKHEIAPSQRERMLKTAPEKATHPLDPLTAAEFQALKEILKGKFSEKSVYAMVQLHEPPKAEVLAFERGRPFRREALIALLDPERKTAYEVLVDLRLGKIVSQRPLENLQPNWTLWDDAVSKEVIDSSPEVRAALEKRGYRFDGKKVSEVLCMFVCAPGREFSGGGAQVAATVGATQPNGSARTTRVVFADRQGGINDFGPAVEGLMVLVDVFERKITAVINETQPAMRATAPHDVFDSAVLGNNQPPAVKPAAPAAIDGLHVAGNHVRWGDWDFRYGFNLREGLTLHQIGFDDGEKLRSICYRASVAELFVPYSDPSSYWLWREYFDAGEYCLGASSSAARAGKEIPAGSVTMDAVLVDYALLPWLDSADRVFFYERDGGALVTHFQASSGSRVYARAKELVVGFIATAGNYDYIFKWVFRQDGSFDFEADLHGIVQTKVVGQNETCEVCAQEQAADGPGTYVAAGEQAFGSLVSPQLVGVSHQHWISLRMDFDIDGPANAVKELNRAALPIDAVKNPAGRAFASEATVFGTEREAQRSINLATDRSWVVFNPSSRGPLGHQAGYHVQPRGNTVSCLPESRFGEQASFTQRHVWVTKFNQEQLYSAGRYPNQAPRDYKDHLHTYANDDQSIYKEDLVLWYSLGTTHLTKPEDFPLMPGATVGVHFAPMGFFQKSPALKHANVEVTKR